MAKRKAVQGVKQRHRDYEKYAAKWQRCRDVVAGQDEIHLGRERYLPRLVDETDAEFFARIERTPFFNGSWRTIAGFVGMMFRKPATIEVPKALEKYLEDVTLSGVSFATFAQDVVLECLEVSRIGILVDHPPLKAGLSIAEAERQGQRPSMQAYKAEAIINHRYGRINNKTVLTQVKLAEEKSTPINEFQDEIIPIIRVLDITADGFYRVREFDAKNEEQIGDDVYPVIDNKKLTEIPFYFIGPDGTEGQYEDPVLIDLFDLNIKHYQASADYQHACHMTALPTPVVTGYEDRPDPVSGQLIPTSFKIGSTTAWVFPDAQAKAFFLEFTGQGIDALEKNVLGYERQMAAIGARMLAPEKSGVEAFGTLVMRTSGENSILSAVAIAASSGLTKALEMFRLWAGVAGKPAKFEINRDFIPLNADPASLQAWLAVCQAGRMSAETFFDLQKRADLMPADLTFEEEQARIDANPIEPPVTGPIPGEKPEAAAEE